MASAMNLEVSGIDTFAQSLDLIVSNIVYIVKHLHTTSKLPLKVDREWIIDRVREQISEDGYTVEPMITRTSDGIGPLFKSLPVELRDVIFADCLASGFPHFMASSRSMREEGSRQISKKGVFRMNFGIMVRLNFSSGMSKRAPECQQPRQEIMDSIQHLSVRIKATTKPLPNFWSNIDLDILKQFGGSEVCRRSCKIYIEIKLDVNTTRATVGKELVATLKTLVGFEVVELRVVFPVNRRLPVLPALRKKHMLDPLVASYALCKRSLSPNLGPASMGQDKEGLVMIFKPRSARIGGEKDSSDERTLGRTID